MSENKFSQLLQQPLPAHEPLDTQTVMIQQGNQLIQQLTQLPPSQGKDYEQVIQKIMNYLFQNYLYNLRAQQRDEWQVNVYDLIARIIPKDNLFWNFIVQEMGSRYVVIECKNYAEKISQGQILTTEKYLYAPALRTFAMMCTRQGADDGANKVLRGAIREHGKLIVVLNDNDMISMIQRKQQGADPSDYLFDLVDELFYTLSR